jgi:hypothetical protein
MNTSYMSGFVTGASFHRIEETDYFLKAWYRFSTKLIPSFDSCLGCTHSCAVSGCNQYMIENKNDLRKCSFICSSCWACDCSSNVHEWTA